VLKAAVEGRLVPTEAELARAEGRDYEPASVLLERILAERRRRWHESGARGKYQEPAAPDTTSLPSLPEGWCWATVDALAELKGGITKGQKRRSTDVLREVPYLRVANVQRGRLDLAVVKTIEATETEIDELRLRPGDVLFNEEGDRDKLGRGWVWNGELPECIHQNHVFRARIPAGVFNPKLLSWYGNTAGQRYFFEEGKQTTNLASINLTRLRGLPVPIPPLAEQTRIVEEGERLLSLADEVELLRNLDTRRCARLRQAILRWAFEGKLADQDPNDEPAAALLERIRSQTLASRPRAGDTEKSPPRSGRRRSIGTK
jgi:type I restriction enzyme S subunit